jgi:hypothetical protein
MPSENLARVMGPEDMPGTHGPLYCGDLVVLNSGGPLLLVVDIDGEQVTASPMDGEEMTLPRLCFSLIGRRGNPKDNKG